MRFYYLCRKEDVTERSASYVFLNGINRKRCRPARSAADF